MIQSILLKKYLIHRAGGKNKEVAFTSAGFFWAEAGVPGLLPYLLEEKDVEGPLWYNNQSEPQINIFVLYESYM